MHWRNGYGMRACEFVIWYGFVQLQARPLSGDTLVSNVGSARIMEKCGFTREGVRKSCYVAGQRVRDDLLFGLLREDGGIDLEEMISRFRPT